MELRKVRSPNTKRACDDRNQHITDFFKPTCKPDRDVFNSTLNGSVHNPFLKMQNGGVECCGSIKATPSKLQRQRSARTPNKSPIKEAFLRRSRRREIKATVRNAQDFCARCGMSLLSPRVVIKRLKLPINSQGELEDNGVYKVNGTSLSNKSTSTLTPDSESENGNSSFKRMLFSQTCSDSSDNKNSLTKKRDLRISPISIGLNHSLSTKTKWLENGQIQNGGLMEQKAGHSVLETSISPVHTARSGHLFAYGSRLTIAENESKLGLMRSDSPFSEKEPNLNVVLDAISLSPGLNKFSTYLDGPSSDSSKEISRKETPCRMAIDSLDSDDSFHAIPLSSDDEEEELIKPLDELLQMAAQPVPGTPQKDLNLSFNSLSQSPVPEMPVTRNGLQTSSPYINSLDRLVKEKEESKRLCNKLDEMEKRLNADIEMGFGIADEDMEDMDGELTDEHRAFLKKFTLVTNAIPDQPPGEDIFHLSESGAIFNCQTLHLKHSELSRGSSEESLDFSCDSEYQLMLATEGYFTMVYRFKKCPEVLMRWMFQMVSIHPSYNVSVKILNTLIQITCNNITNLKENPWTPSLLDISTVFANMGIPFETLFPLANIQPSFAASDLVSAGPGPPVLAEHRHSEQIFQQIPQFQVTHVIKFLGFCTGVYREGYCDLEILELLVLLLKIHLEKELKDFHVVDLQCLMQNLLQSIKEWEAIMPKLCIAVSQLSTHHHNFIKLVRLIPTYEVHGREMRRLVSFMCICNTLSVNYTDLPLDYDSRMMMLCQLMSQMKPSALVKNKERIPENESKTFFELDAEVYYQTFSLLHLVNDASSSEDSPTVQRKHLLKMCAELEKHIKSDIREDPRLFYRTKVKDLIARIHGRWQELLLYSRPNQGKLHDYWEPVCDDSFEDSSPDTVSNSPQEHFCE
ncbi:SMC5-SMC6 complex localization factor protein 2 isoform X2 [Mixophyes fleayi]|uniref:SMC5-SMC6 complex localization factor protein 2 isoform X2 n=1 Tax=Mixophyes fleayi TaxID=3061075 RepID=UPI003F4D93D5